MAICRIGDLVEWDKKAIVADGGEYMANFSRTNIGPFLVVCVVPAANGTCGVCDPKACNPEHRRQVRIVAGVLHCQMVEIADSEGKHIDGPFGPFISAAYLMPQDVSGC